MKKINFVIILLVIGITITGCEKITDTVIMTSDMPDTQPLTVMTYNVYVGSSAEPLLNVENIFQVPTEVAKMYDNVMASDFPSRALAIAKSIKEYHPHIIGLQEISLIRRQSPGDFIPDNPIMAEEVVLDYLKILMDALNTEGLNYQVAAQVENLDVEMPMISDTGLDDIRLTDYDVILTRNDVEISRQTNYTYENKLIIDMLGLDIKRGYAAVDATVSGTTYRIVNTHLEAYTEENRIQQTKELIQILADETLPTIMLGDFNTRAPDGNAYQLIQDADYFDLWQMDSSGNGNTCCQDDDILNEVSDLKVRIDQIFVRNFPTPSSVQTFTVGDKQEDKLLSGLWPSDHAGVVALISF
ncbi:endonuclease/exonuclease/phosphatase family protein [Candidatus Poribacteria bacterium]|nr:endonuclease/exonuclease/phosphatase family protein [Candidatus Poribacteria bacterium]